MRPVILVVDNDANVRFRVAGMLEKVKDYQCITANGVGEARTALANNEVNIVLTDCEMGDGNGFDLFRLMREDGFELPVVMMSGNHFEPDDLNGFHGFVPKPIMFPVLFEMLESALGK